MKFPLRSLCCSLSFVKWDQVKMGILPPPRPLPTTTSSSGIGLFSGKGEMASRVFLKDIVLNSLGGPEPSYQLMAHIILSSHIGAHSS